VGAYFSGNEEIESCYTISEDGALVTWKCNYNKEDQDGDQEVMVDDALDFFTGGGNDLTELDGKTQAHQLVNATWSVQSRHYFHQEGASVTAASYCERAQLLVVGFSSGIFGLYEMPSVSNIHTLSVGSNQIIKTCILNYRRLVGTRLSFFSTAIGVGVAVGNLCIETTWTCLRDAHHGVFS
jgi:periodic tryptophan protein 2